MSSKKKITLSEGLHVSHLFYKINYQNWNKSKAKCLDKFSNLVKDINQKSKFQIAVYSVIAQKADLAILLISPDLIQHNQYEKKIAYTLRDDIFQSVYSYYSLTELSDYTTKEDEYPDTLLRYRPELKKGTKEFDTALVEFTERMKKYRHFRLYPKIPDWPVFCFYPMSKSRASEANWFMLDFKKRKELMGQHAITGRKWAGKILQMITASTGLDYHEWGVTLFAHNPEDIKNIVYEMRFDEVSAKYAIFGDFYLGIKMPIKKIFKHLNLK